MTESLVMTLMAVICVLDYRLEKFVKNYFNVSNDFSKKTIVYLSDAKVKSFYTLQEKVGKSGGATIAGIGGNASVSSRQKTEPEILKDVHDILRKQNNERYDVENLEPRNYYRVFLAASAGTFWPWGDEQDSEIKDTAWWVGEGKDATVLAYGKLAHVDGQGEPPEYNKSSTWWPSRVGTHRVLVDSLVKAASEESAGNPVNIVKSRDSTLRGLLDYCFNNGVRRSAYVEKPAIYEMLLRVDEIEKSEGEKPIVAGSPVWVARVMNPLPGTYLLEQKPPKEAKRNAVYYRIITDKVNSTSSDARDVKFFSQRIREIPDLAAYGVWDGKRWLGTYWGNSRDHKMVYDISIESPEVPKSSCIPKSTDVRSLGISEGVKSAIKKESLWGKKFFN